MALWADYAADPVNDELTRPILLLSFQPCLRCCDHSLQVPQQRFDERPGRRRHTTLAQIV